MTHFVPVKRVLITARMLPPRRGLVNMLWLAAMLTIAAFVTVRIGAFDLLNMVTGPDGQPISIVNTFATVDHPFHAARAETLRRSLADGQPLRWIANHQGGYPAEFYPLGVAWLEVGVWAVLLGLLPMMAVHKLVVIGLFLLPGLAFWQMARGERRSAGAAVLAFAAHVAVPGGSYSGGYRELVEWALVTNVAAAIATVFVLHWATLYVSTGSRVAAVGAVIAATAAICTNPRSLIALGVVGIGAWVAAVVAGAGWTRATGRLALIGGVAGLLAAPELMSLARFQGLYFFLRYSGYATWREYLDASVTAVSWPVFGLALLGIASGVGQAAAGFSRRRQAAKNLSDHESRTVTTPVESTYDRRSQPRRGFVSIARRFNAGKRSRTAPFQPATTVASAVALVLYAVTTGMVGAFSGDGEALANLEATRLMPVQRLLTIYLAAAALETLLIGAIGRSRWMARDLGLALAALLILAWFLTPLGGLDDDERTLFPVATTGVADTADFEAAIDAADAAAPPGTAILIIGSTLGWHQQLWAPTRTDRPLYYDDWLWYWHTRHPGPYDYQQGHFYPVPALALDRSYLERQAIGAVVVSGRTQAAATASPELGLIRTGTYDVYAVQAPTPIATLPDGAAPDTLTANPHGLRLSGQSAGGEVLIRRNWFPRWQATVNGDPTPVTRTADGYMTVVIPPGPITLELTYSVDNRDWLARIASLVGASLVGWWAFVAVRKRRPSRPR